MKPYFAKYLPVEGEIKIGDHYYQTCYAPTQLGVATDVEAFENGYYKQFPKVKLFLCSRDIKVGDTVFGNNFFTGKDKFEVWSETVDKYFAKSMYIKVIGEIPWIENFEKEEWSDVEGYEGLYLISSFGRLYSLPRNKWNGKGDQKIGGHLLTFGEQKDGYPKVTLCKDGNCKAVRPYRLVAKAFIPNPENLPDVNHKDNNPKNCHFSNLEWTNQQRNIAYAVAQGRQIQGERVNHSKLTKDEVLTIRDRIRRKECSQHQIAKEFKVSQGVISDIINRKSWRHV